MADGGHDLTVRMSTEDQNIDGRLNYDYIFSYFKRFKVKISYAIEKTFPFLELLRDHEFITNEMFEDCQASCRNLVPVNNVIYSILDELEKKFNLEVLKILFDDDNIKEYPGLIPIYKTFLNVLPDKWYLQGIDEKGREEGPSSQLTLEQGNNNRAERSQLLRGKGARVPPGTGENSFPSLPGPHLDSSFSTGTTPPESGLLEHLCETEQANTRRHDTTGDKNDELGHPQANQQCAQEPEPPGTICEDSEKPSDGDGPLGASISALESEHDKKVISDYGSSDLGKKEAQEATRSRPQIAPERKTANPGPLKRRSSRRSKRRVSKFPRDESMNFLLPELPVTCGDIKGILYKEKLKQGTSEKCIKSETRRWFTLRRFEIKGGYEKTSNWKLSIRCGGFTLKELIEGSATGLGEIQVSGFPSSLPPVRQPSQQGEEETWSLPPLPVTLPTSWKAEAAEANLEPRPLPWTQAKKTGGTEGRALRMAGGGHELYIGSRATQPRTPNNSFPVCLMDIKKKPLFNSEDEQQAQARTNHNQASDIIVITNEDSEKCNDGDEPLGAPLSALEMIKEYGSSKSPEREETQEATCSQPQNTPDPVNIGNTSTCCIRKRKRPLRAQIVQCPNCSTVITNEDSEESNDGDEPLGAPLSALEMSYIDYLLKSIEGQDTQASTCSGPQNAPALLPLEASLQFREANPVGRLPTPVIQAAFFTSHSKSREPGSHPYFLTFLRYTISLSTLCCLCLREDWQRKWAEQSSQGLQSNSYPVHLMDKTKKKTSINSGDEQQAQARTNHNQASDIIVISSEDSEESNDEEKPPRASISALEMVKEYGFSESHEREETQEATCSQPQNAPGADLQRPEKEKCSCVMCFSSGVPTSQEATAESSQTSDMMDTTDAGNNSALKKHSGKRRGKRRHIANVKSLQRSKKKYQRIPKDKSMNFQLPKLPVTCGKAKGTLNKKKLKRGTSKRCIKSEAGRWLTLREFEILGGYRLSKNWKLSVRCGGYTLKELIENGHIQNPPRTRTPENSNICVVCKTWGTLLCCDTCPRSFHENCHIPPVEPERNGWSCIFCKIKVIQGRCPESQPRRQESEVLRMQMLPEEQLKCEFLLLKVYCYSKTLFIASKPYYSRVGSQGPQRPKWLDNVKKSLNKKKYPQVKGFVGDMRLVFQNDKLLYRKNKSTRLILKVQKNFEKNFKNIFAIQETSKNNSPL
nr:uncharacterized protein LOC105862812 [Microcebus murinus]